MIDFKSKIFWINVVSVVIAVLALVQDSYPNYAKVVVLVVGILTIVLRQLQGKVVLGVRL